MSEGDDMRCVAEALPKLGAQLNHVAERYELAAKLVRANRLPSSQLNGSKEVVKLIPPTVKELRRAMDALKEFREALQERAMR